MTKESGCCERPNHKRSRSSYCRIETAGDANNIEGIFMALRYLSVEAEGAGLTDLANTLETAASQYDRYIAKSANGYEGTQKHPAATKRSA